MASPSPSRWSIFQITAGLANLAAILCITCVLIQVNVFPFSCPVDVLIQHSLPPSTIDREVMAVTRSRTGKYLDFLQKIASVSSGSDSMSVDPFGFPEQQFPNPDHLGCFIASGPLRDLYGFPLLPVRPGEEKSVGPALHLPGGLNLFSFGWFARNKAFLAEQEDRERRAGELRPIFSRNRMLTIALWVALSLLIFFFVQRYETVDAGLWEGGFKIVLGVISLTLLIVFLNPSGSGCGIGNHELDPGHLDAAASQALARDFREFVGELEKGQQLSSAARDTILQAIGRKGYEIPEHFSGRFRSEHSRSSYWGVQGWVIR